jgi:hypothetical protein
LGFYINLFSILTSFFLKKKKLYKGKSFIYGIKASSFQVFRINP